MENELEARMPMYALIAAVIIGIVAMFLPWVVIYFDDGVGLTGIDLLTRMGDIKEYYVKILDNIGWQNTMPLLIVILGIVAAVVAALPTFGVQIDSKISFGIIAVLGLIMLILLIAYGATELNTPRNGSEFDWVKLNLAGMGGSGLALAYIPCLVTTFVGVKGLIKSI